MAGPLRGLKTIEMGGLGPAPFCAMLLTDMGAEIVRIERPGGAALISHRFDVTARGREMLELDLRQPRMIHSRSSSNLPVAAISTLTQTATNTGVYKCKTAQGKTEYSDLPCAGAANTGIHNSPTTSSTENPNARALGIYVQEALAQKDFKRAKWLASTPEHFDMIRVAEEEESKRRKARFDRAMKVETVNAINRGNAINKANGEKLDENNRLQAEANRHLEDLKNKPNHCRTFVTGRHADTRCD